MAGAGPSTALAQAMLQGAVSSGDLADVTLATGDPGSAGTANPSSVTTPESVTWPTVSGASVSASNQPGWTSWAGTNGEQENYIVLKSTGGTFGASMQLGSPVTMDTGDSLTLTEIQLSITGLAS